VQKQQKLGGVNLSSKKSILILLSLAMVFGLFLAACGSDTTNGDTTKETAPEDTGSKDTGSDTKEDPKEETATEPKDGGDLIIGSIGSPTLFNDLYSTDTASSEITSLMFDGMLQSSPGFEPEPVLAKSWDISEDGLTWVFHLKEGVKWHDGEEFTADDVVFTFQIPLSEDYTGPRASSFEDIESVKALDEYTVEIILSEANAKFLWTSGYAILPEHILGDVPIAELGEHDFNTKNPIGTGAFKFGEWVDGQYVKVVAFDDYHQGRPHLDSITTKIVPDQNALLAQLQAGDIHMTGVPASDLETVQEWENQGKVNISSTLSLGYTYMGYNLRQEKFQDVNVRRALTHAIDREAIIAGVLNGDGQIAHAPASPLSWSYNPDTPQFNYDPEKAKQLLADAGWKDTDGDGILDKDGQKFEFTLKTNQGNKAREQIAVVVQQQLAEVGISVTPKLMEWSAFIEDVTAPNWNYDALILGWALGTDPDPTGIWHSKEIEEGLNFVAYSRPKLDELMDQQIKELDQEKRKVMVWEIFAEIASDQPYTFLYYPNAHVAMQPYMKGFTHHPRADRYKANEWWFDN
jgi:peptide/nickel transport system substrate-binding protein